jgi:plasmid stability protein
MRRVARVRTTLTIDEDLLKAVKVRAARTGRGDSEVIEEAVRRELGWDALDRIWAQNDMPEDEAMELALEAQRWARQQRRRAP